MLKLMAYDPHDSWAYVQEGERYFLTRPPHQEEDRGEVSRKAVVRAVTHHEYLASEREFETWEAVFAFVRGEVQSTRKDQRSGIR